MSRPSYFKLYLVRLAFSAIGMFCDHAWGLEPQDARAYCNEVEQAAQAAQMKYLQTYQPRTNPGQTFDDATLPCLDFIANFKSSLPSLLDDTVLTQIAKQLLERTCQAARDQFDKAINDAKQSISGVVGPMPEMNQGAAFYRPGDNLPNTTTPALLEHAAPPMQRPEVRQTIDRVINILK